MKWIITILAISALAAGALAQTNTPTNANWDVLAAWGQLPAGANWGAPSQVSTTPEGQIVFFRRMVPFFFVFNEPCCSFLFLNLIVVHICTPQSFPLFDTSRSSIFVYVSSRFCSTISFSTSLSCFDFIYSSLSWSALPII